MDSKLVVLAHREPYEEQATDDGPRLVLKTNGVFRTLDAVLRERAGTWIAWRARDADAWHPRVEAPAGEDGSSYQIRRIPLTPAEADRFYYDFTSTALWPVLFSMLDRARFTRAAWETYRRVNQQFADAVCEEAADGAIVWINDFHLMLVPRLLKDRRPDLTLALFLHTAFPPPDTFGIIPWREELMDGLLHLDIASFHIPSYALNFANTAERFMGARAREFVSVDVRENRPAIAVSRYPRALVFGDHEVRLSVHAVGVDTARLTELASAPRTLEDARRIHRELGCRQMILSAERLDYVKGFQERLECFERYLERHPDRRGDVAFVQIGVPTRSGMDEFQEMRRRTEEAVGRINGRFGTLEWAPVHFFYTSFPLDELVAFYRAAAVAWVTPLRDGLNLVAKEYVASRVDEDGVLVLSEFAGAAAELDGAVLTNPYSPDDMDQALAKALDMPEAERGERMRQLRRRVQAFDVHRWARSFLSDAQDLAAHRHAPSEPSVV